MQRYNRIGAGPYTEATNQLKEALLSVDAMPGTLVQLVDDQFAPADPESPATLYALREDQLRGQGTYGLLKAGERVAAYRLLNESTINLPVAAESALTRGTPLTLGLGGELVEAEEGQHVVASSNETYYNVTGERQLVQVIIVSGSYVPDSGDNPEPDEPPYSFTMTAGVVTDTFFGYLREQGVAGEISREPFPGMTLANLYTVAGNFLIFQVKGDVLADYSDYRIAIDGLLIDVEWALQEGDPPESYVMAAPPPVMFEDGVDYEITFVKV